ncbi:MAG: diaminopimelate decarboxylase [Clostridia bacterium]|nr:diaminopimelate decarboxylase [Clostridia bacterium]
MFERKINGKGHLEIGGADAVALAEKFGTPLYVYDENYIRGMMRVFRKTLEQEYDGNGLVLYASKAFSCMGMYAIAKSEGLGADVVSGGELYTALKAGFPAEKMMMHGNNKLKDELALAVKNNVGWIVVDSLYEADMLNELTKEAGKVQNILLRINPGVEAHTHAYVQTATPDSKFGFSVADGSAKETVKNLLTKTNLCLKGFHCHIGSKIFEKQSFVLAAEKCFAFLSELKGLGFEAEVLNLGGGYGIHYTKEDPDLNFSDYADYFKALIDAVKSECKKRNLKRPYLCIEPGRSIVGEAGITLYKVGAIKEIKGIKKYLAVDGGMFESPRYCLYGSKYEAMLANRANEAPTEVVSIAGKCCESGDLIGEGFNLPQAKSGDILAVFSTGAYHYSMASNYNRNPVPPVVIVKDGNAEYLVKPQTYEDLIRNDVLPQSEK